MNGPSVHNSEAVPHQYYNAFTIFSQQVIIYSYVIAFFCGVGINALHRICYFSVRTVPDGIAAKRENKHAIKIVNPKQSAAIPGARFIENKYKGSNKMKVCCFSGTKPREIIWEYENSALKFNQLKADIMSRLATPIEHDHVTQFICGITSEADLFIAEIVLELKKDYPVTLECVLLCADQPLLWQPDERARYLSIARQADHVKALQDTYSTECHKQLNEYLVKMGDYFMVIFKGMFGYALDTIDQAYEHGKCIFIINSNHT